MRVRARLLLVCLCTLLFAVTATAQTFGSSRDWLADLTAILINDDQQSTIDDIRLMIEDGGGNVVSYASPGVILAQVPNASMTMLAAHPNIRKISKTVVNAAAEGVTAPNAVRAIDYFNWVVTGQADSALSPPPPPPPPGGVEEVFLEPEDIIAAASGLDQLKLHHQVLGTRVKVNLVIVNLRDSAFTTADKTKMYNAIQLAMSWWNNRILRHFGVNRPVNGSWYQIEQFELTPAAGDPIKAEEMGIWVNSAMEQACGGTCNWYNPNAGFGDAYTAFHSNVLGFNAAKQGTNLDSITVFAVNGHLVTPTSGTVDGYLPVVGASWLAVGNNNPLASTAATMAHEIAHVYWACDEGNSPHVRATGCASCDEYRDALNGNALANDNNCTIPDRRREKCLMSNADAGYSLLENDFDTEVEKLCWYTREQIGWATNPQTSSDPTNRTYCWNDVNWDVPNQATRPRVWEAQYFNDSRPRMPLTHWTGAPRYVTSAGTSTIETLSVNFLTNPLNHPCIIGTGTTTPRTQYFSTRFRRMINFPAGDYEFTATTGIDGTYPRVDEARVYVGNVQLKPSATTPGKFEKIRIDGETLVQVDYYNLEVTDPRVDVSWVRVGSTNCPTTPTFFATIRGTQVLGTDLCDLNTPSIVIDVTGVGGIKPYRVTVQRNNDQPITHEMPDDLLVLQPVPLLGDSRYKIIALTDSTGCPANITSKTGVLFNIDPYSPRLVNTFVDVKKTTGCTYQASWRPATICPGIGGTIKYTLEREETVGSTTTPRTLFTCQAKLFHDNSDLVPGVRYRWRLTSYRVPDANASCDNQPKREFPLSQELLMPSCTAAAPTLTTSAVSATYGQRVTLSARLLGNGTPLSNRTITFALAGIEVGTAVTNANGDATLIQTIALNPGVNSGAVAARFGGDATWSLANAANDVSVSSNCLPADVTSQPNDVTISSGGTTSLSVGTSGTAPVTVKWYTASGGYIGNSNPQSISLTQSNSYYAMVSNGCRTTQSRTVTIMVCNKPAISVQPAGGPTITSGTSKTLSVTASGTDALFYRWYKDGVAITGATARTYTFTATASANYHVVVTNGCGTATSNVVTVNVCSTAPAITVQPQNVSITYPGNTNLTVTASGVTPAYQWYQGSVAITGATAATVNVAPAVTTTYKVVVSNACGSVTSNTVTVSVCKPPAITSNPASQETNSGQPVTLYAGASGTSLTYQWYYSNNTAVPGATSSQLTVAPTVTTSYYMKATNTCGTAQTATRTVTVCVPPNITTEPVARQINAGQSATLTCYASSNVNETYQWYYSSGTAISGATGNSITVSPSTTTYYYCVVTNSCGSDISRTVPVSICEPMQITQEPSDKTITAGQPATMTANFYGSSPWSLQWYENGVAMPGRTAAGTTVYPTVTTTYYVRGTNSCGSVQSRTVTVTVN